MAVDRDKRGRDQKWRSLRRHQPHPAVGRRILFTRAPATPERMLLFRSGLVVALFVLVFLFFYLDRDGLVDNKDKQVSLLDVVYFTMVTVTTVGYGDIVPVSDRARFIDAILVTPIRLFIFFIFLGTAYQMVIQRVIEDFRMRRLQQRLRDHIVICGFGSTGRTAAEELVSKGQRPDTIIVIDPSEEALAAAAEAGYVGLKGDATRDRTVEDTCVGTAKAVIVSAGRDDTNVLIVLTVRNLGPKVRIIAAVAEEENVKLLRQSGADATVSPAKLGGYILADAVFSGRAADCLCDLMSEVGRMRMVEREPAPEEIGRRSREVKGEVVLRIYRGDRQIEFWHEDDECTIRQGDRLLVVQPTP
jgi:voltage-gated potassium channel